MTNEEKIEEIVIDAFEGWSKVGFTYDEIIAILSKLAEWKDQQFKEYLEKLKDKYNKEYRKLASKSNDEYVQGEREAYGRLCMVVEIINELFGEEVKVNNSDNDE